MALLVACVILFYRHQQYLFEDQDALYLQTLARESFAWKEFFLGGTWRQFSMMGSPMLFNGELIPSFYVFRFGLTGSTMRIVFFTILAFQLFLGTYSLCRAFAVSQPLALGAAWICVNMVLPLQQNPVPLGQVYTVWPFFGHAASLLLFSLAAFRMIGRTRTIYSTFVSALLFVALLLLQVCTAVYTSPLVLPPTALACLCMMLLVQSRHELYYKISALVVLALILLTGPFFWTVGHVLYSARHMFSNEILTTYPLPFLVSCMFYGSVVPKIAIAGSLAGALLMVREKNVTLRLCAATYLFYMFVVAIFSAVYLSHKFDLRSLPHPIYLEYVTTPLYSIFFSYGVLWCYRRFCGGTAQFYCVNIQRILPGRGLAWVGSHSKAILVCIVLCYFLIQGVSTFYFRKIKHPTDLEPSLLTETMARGISIEPSSDFRGRAATILMCGSYTDTEIAAGVTLRCTGEHLTLPKGLNNAHIPHHLWSFGIPTLDGHEQSLSIPYYLLYSRLASHAAWLNSCSCLSRFNLPLLAASGTRYVVSARPVKVSGLKPRCYVSMDTNGIVDQSCVESDEDFYANSRTGKGFYLYELEYPNIGQYSPTVVRVASTLNDAVGILSDPSFEFDHEVVLHEDLPSSVTFKRGQLIDRIRFVPGGARIEADSEANSLMLLPFEFSHCISFEPDPGTSGQVKLYRANIAMTALVFQGHIKGTLHFSYGPWTNSHARLQDLADLKKLRVEDVVRNPLRGDDRYILVP